MADVQVGSDVGVGSGYMLTTVDNPFDPFTQWREWLTYDESSGYHTCGLLARVTITSNELSDVDQEEAIQLAIDEIVKENVSGVHRKVLRDQMKQLNDQSS